ATKKPKPALAKPQEKKRKLVTETSEEQSPAKRSKASKVVKKRTKKSSLQLVRRADLKEYTIAERDFKYMYPSDFEDLYLLNLQDTAKPHRWDASDFEFKHHFTVIDSPRAVTFRDKYEVQMILRFNEIHKFSDGTLQQIDKALDYRVKEFKVNRINPGLNIRFWTRKDVDRSKEFMFAIQKQLKTKRIFRNLESFVGGRIRDGDYRLLKRTE
ncbi:hypothetical protein Tco_0106642, partial [Tanacetum coccineum]